MKYIFRLVDGNFDFKRDDREGFDKFGGFDSPLHMKVYIRTSDGMICGPPKKVARLMMQTFEECLLLDEKKMEELSILYALQRFKDWTNRQKANFAVSVIRGFAVLP